MVNKIKSHSSIFYFEERPSFDLGKFLLGRQKTHINPPVNLVCIEFGDVQNSTSFLLLFNQTRDILLE